MATISDNVLRAPLRTDEIITVITVPPGKSIMRFVSPEIEFYARKGATDAAVPDSSFVSDGSASWPYAAGVVYEVAVAGGERYTFVAQTGVAKPLVVAFE